MHPTVIAGPYLADILAQPDALRSVRMGLARQKPMDSIVAGVRAGHYRRFVLTGMGSSLHATYPLHLRLAACGLDSLLVETSELLLEHELLRSRETLLVAVSQSGESAEMVGLMRDAAEFGHIIGVTNYPLSTLGRAAGTVVPLEAGVESTVSCKTYLNTLAALYWLASTLTGGDTTAALDQLESIEPLVAAYLDETEHHVTSLRETVAGVRSIFVVGRGVSLATAWTGGLILKESTQQHAEGMSCAGFRHGPLEMIGPDVLVVVLAGDPRVAALHRRLADDVARGGGKAVFVAATDASGVAFRLPPVPVALLPMVEILPLQMLSLAVAARDGREAGRFERATKITTVD